MPPIILRPLSALTESAARIYLDAFPAEERRPLHCLSRLVEDPRSPLSLLAISVEGCRDAGFLTLWKLPSGFFYIEHLATRPELRGRGLGEAALARLDKITGGAPIVIEVEMPENEMARRRIDFYRRSGYLLHDDFRYLQPPYSASLPSVEMRLMTRGNLAGAKIEDIAQELRQTVYLTDYSRPCSSPAF